MQTLAYKILAKIKDEAVSHIFVVPGKNIIPFLSAIDQLDEYVCGVVCATELGAGFMADGYSRVTRNFGTVITISGPGFSNLYGALVNAYYDNSKLLILCGTPKTEFSGKNSFQDASLYKLDCSVVAADLCSYSCNLNTCSVQNQLRNSFFNLKNYNLPVFVQISVDIQVESTDIHIDAKVVDKRFLNYSALSFIENLILSKKAFLFVTGRSAVKYSAAIKKFCEKHYIPAASTLCSKGVIPENKDYYLGIFGFGMSPRTFAILNNADFEYIIAIGLDLTERNTSRWTAYRGKNIIHLDQIVSENSRDYEGVANAYLTDVTLLLEALENNSAVITKLNETVSARKKLLSDIIKCVPYTIPIEHSCDKTLYVDQVLKFLNTAFYQNTNVVVDSGLHRLYCAHLWRTYDSNAYFTSINNAHMGWAIAACIGIKLGDSKKDCICITGDGCMLMNGTEIQTAAKYNIRVFFIVLNNNAHGAMSCENLNKNNFVIPDHDWVSFGRSLGVESLCVNNIPELQAACNIYMASEGPVLINVKCGYDENIFLNKYYTHLQENV